MDFEGKKKEKQTEETEERKTSSGMKRSVNLLKGRS
jgi:hypothetical protein